MYFSQYSSNMVLSINKEYVDFDISFSIRPQVKTAPLFITSNASNKTDKNDYISIAMRNGIVEAR